MPGSYSGCVRKNLKTWITLVILLQCVIVLLYLDVTKSVTSPSLLSLLRRSVLGTETNPAAGRAARAVSGGGQTVSNISRLTTDDMGLKQDKRVYKDVTQPVLGVKVAYNVHEEVIGHDDLTREDRKPFRYESKPDTHDIKLSNKVQPDGSSDTYPVASHGHDGGRTMTLAPIDVVKGPSQSEQVIPWKYRSLRGNINREKQNFKVDEDLIRKTVQSIIFKAKADSSVGSDAKPEDRKVGYRGVVADVHDKGSDRIAGKVQTSEMRKLSNKRGFPVKYQNGADIGIVSEPSAKNDGKFEGRVDVGGKGTSGIRGVEFGVNGHSVSEDSGKGNARVGGGPGRPQDSWVMQRVDHQNGGWYPDRRDNRPVGIQAPGEADVLFPGNNGLNTSEQRVGLPGREATTPPMLVPQDQRNHGNSRASQGDTWQALPLGNGVHSDIVSNEASQHSDPVDPAEHEPSEPITPVTKATGSVRRKWETATEFLRRRVFQLPDPESTESLFVTQGPLRCLREGTNLGDDQLNIQNYSAVISSMGCHCKFQWHGYNCSIPDMYYFSSGSGFIRGTKPRTHFRRVINALAFNVEFELLEARLYELNDVVDVFIIFESNFSNFGEPKPLRLLERLRKGYLTDFHHKIVYIMRDYFPDGGKENGWLVDEHMRTLIGREGLSRVTNTRPDDLFIYTDADELPSRAALQFLRLHDGYPEPFGFSLRWSVFGFFWKQYEPTRIYAGCTLSMMRYVFQYSAFELRAGDYFSKHSSLIQGYIKSGGNVYEWHLGESGFPAGWHCSWCLPVEGIQIKLKSAINADFPRWGDYPQKLKLDYIRSLIKQGIWFDDQMRFDSRTDADHDDHYAPKYFLDHYKNYTLLLDFPK